MANFLQACVTFGCVFGIVGIAYLVYIAHLEQKRMTSKGSDKQIPDQSRINQWPPHVYPWQLADI